ncbi:cytochrome P450 [Amycolatopsis sp. YIM 10]|uniref:cytochrome P450 n=1 Tax=Amycolatopsis sp. YIM 10 TaxID=2653857 RepID=UPI00128FF312|nr:cytochrome P450 [Amycolatopsis sp. YIM 10]QFU88168.1 putative bifunctional P-450/NADPH-P450 reductase 2 [Amycolatopsis sp. YIM 10]
MPRPSSENHGLTTLPATDAFRVLSGVALPTIANGVIKRLPPVMRLAEKVRVDETADRVLRRLRDRHGDGPLLIKAGGRTFALPLSSADAGRVLDGSPSPFSPANLEKSAALSHFQPHGVLISQEPERGQRRQFNENVLETGEPLHHLAPALAEKVREEASRMLALAEVGGRLDWHTFNVAWWRIVRRVTLGDAARDDHRTTDLLAGLRMRANLAYGMKKNRAAREELGQRLRAHVARAEKDCLAGVVAQAPAQPETDPLGQIPHWLFAFDAAGITSYRTLALLATHPAERAKALEDKGPLLPYLRACELESVRLWPTTPMILRDSTEDTDWPGGTLPAGSTVLIFAPFFHRDEEELPFAHRFTPEIWLDGRAQEHPALVPFSAGPAECPGRNLVLLVTSTLLSALLERAEFTALTTLEPGRLPSTLDNFGLRFDITAPRQRP